MESSAQGWLFRVDKEAENQLPQSWEGNFFFFSLIQQNGNGLLVFPNANNNNCRDRFVIATIDFLPQYKLFLKMPLNGFLFAGRVGVSGWACSERSRSRICQALKLKSEKKGKSGEKKNTKEKDEVK